METIFDDNSIITNTINMNNNRFIPFINTLEGYKTRIKNLHWAADGFNIHKRLDELLDTVSEFQDSLAEDSMGIYGKMESSVIKGNYIMISEPIKLLQSLINDTVIFYKSIGTESILSGIKSETEVFIHSLNKLKYLFSLCKC